MPFPTLTGAIGSRGSPLGRGRVNAIVVPCSSAAKLLIFSAGHGNNALIDYPGAIFCSVFPWEGNDLEVRMENLGGRAAGPAMKVFAKSWFHRREGA